MESEIINEFEKKYFNLDDENLHNWAKLHPQIGNVLRGLTNECFSLAADFEQSDEIYFIYIYDLQGVKGVFLKLKFGEKHFYPLLLEFSLQIVRIVNRLEMFGVYRTFIHFLRTFYESNDITTCSASELNKMGNGFLVSASPFEVIPTFEKNERIDFYRMCFGVENYNDVEEGKEYVYLMMNEDEFTFKIGQSKKPKYRERTLQYKEPSVVLMKVWQCDKKIERELHRLYSKNRIRGEWFKFTFEELQQIDAAITNMIMDNK